ncbi:TPA: P27 family phage terminase small subunit [Vibrio parahaemolyticus]|uniref:P27 family phage terminase small subunit n=1 Tax=Vibrio alginolyticus TaxID=663 RepID=UPI001EEDB9B7|nr:P27 family phage terminase small subunit [Vibrio alginolyticus]EJE4165365.1 P27 family phage terminase small subunit [Vibrio parahaemolyticus]ULF71814.1 P27 family phage terminase small subunit [Vibrio alginolyticus]HCE4628159.1 P27 family phage terminase small subunit [Vibrio parahaemolyticus]
MANKPQTPAARLKELYAELNAAYEQIQEEGRTYTTISTQGQPVKKRNPIYDIYLQLQQEIRMIEVEQGRTALGKERRKKLAAEAKKLEAEATQFDTPKNDRVTSFLLS